jgi:hypothetical protein
LPSFAQVNSAAPLTPKSADEVKALIGAVYDHNEIVSVNVPYHFLATFQTFKADGQPDGEGSIERWAASPNRMKTTTRFRDHSATEYRTDGTAYGTVGDTTLFADDGFSGSIMSYFVNYSLFYAAFRPAAILSRNVETSVMSLQGDVLDCGMFVFEVGPAAYPQPPKDNFCVSRDSGNLVLRQTAGISIRYRDFAPFLDKSIPRTISASKGPQVRFRIKIEQLDQATLDDVGMAAPADASLTSPLPNIWATKPEETSPSQTTKVPVVPELKAAHASGTVVLYVLISQTGAVADVEPIFASSPALADYATQLARGYTYKPILRHDKPLEEIAHAWFNFKF